MEITLKIGDKLYSGVLAEVEQIVAVPSTEVEAPEVSEPATETPATEETPAQ